MPIAVAPRYRFKPRNEAKQLRGNCFYAAASRASLLKTISSCRDGRGGGSEEESARRIGLGGENSHGREERGLNGALITRDARWISAKKEEMDREVREDEKKWPGLSALSIMFTTPVITLDTADMPA